MKPDTYTWYVDGERHLATALGRLVDEEFDEPSLLPDWSRRHVLAHVANNADALINLLTWARTGVETPMYASQEARDAGIEETSKLPPDQLRAQVLAATQPTPPPASDGLEAARVEQAVAWMFGLTSSPLLPTPEPEPVIDPEPTRQEPDAAPSAEA